MSTKSILYKLLRFLKRQLHWQNTVKHDAFFLYKVCTGYPGSGFGSGLATLAWPNIGAFKKRNKEREIKTNRRSDSQANRQTVRWTDISIKKFVI